MRHNVATGHEGGGTQGGCRQDRSAIGLVEIGSHAGHVAHVVAHVIGDSRRVARVILRDTGLNLADQVGTDIGRFRIDTATDTGEERLRRGTHAEGQHRGGNDGQFMGWIHRVGGDQGVQQDIPERNVK